MSRVLDLLVKFKKLTKMLIEARNVELAPDLLEEAKRGIRSGSRPLKEKQKKRGTKIVRKTKRNFEEC